MLQRFLLRRVSVSITLLLTSALGLAAQSWVWERAVGGPKADAIGGLAIDSLSSSYVAGIYTGSITIGVTTFSNGQNIGFYIAKYNSFGTPQWAAQGNGAGTFHNATLAVLRDGTCFVTGSFSGSVTIGDAHLTSQGGHDIFIAKYSYYGIQQWARSIGGAGDDDALAVAADSATGFVIAGGFTGSSTIGGATLTSAGDADLFVAKYDSSGNPVWGMRGGGTGEDRARGVAVDRAGIVWASGSFHGTATINGTALTAAGAETDIFLVRIENNGVPQWAVRYGGAGADVGRGIAIDAAGNAYLTGSFSGTVAFGGVSRQSKGGTDLFVAKVDPTNAVLWATAAGGTGEDEGVGIAVDTLRNCYVAGSFSIEVLLGDAGGLTALGGTDILIAKLRPDGRIVDAMTGDGPRDDRGVAVASDGTGEVYVAATFDSVAGFQSGGVLSSTGGVDGVVARIGRPSTIFTGEIAGAPFCSDAAILIPFTVTGLFDPTNVFTAQLSDANGSFASPTNLGSLPGTEGGTINATIPPGITDGTKYRIQVVASAPPIRGTFNNQPLAIYGRLKPVISPAGTSKVCSGHFVELDAGGGYASYQWSNGGNARTIRVGDAGSYNVIVSNDAGCVGASDSVTVIVLQSPVKPEIVRTDSVLESTPAEFYQWLRDGQPISGATARRYVVPEPGIYSVRIMNSDGCTTDSDPAIVTAGVPAERLLAGVMLAPVPTDGDLAVSFTCPNPAHVDILVFDAAGRPMVHRSEAHGGGAYRSVLDLSALPAGAYFVRVTAGARSWVGEALKR